MKSQSLHSLLIAAPPPNTLFCLPSMLPILPVHLQVPSHTTAMLLLFLPSTSHFSPLCHLLAFISCFSLRNRPCPEAQSRLIDVAHLLLSGGHLKFVQLLRQGMEVKVSGGGDRWQQRCYAIAAVKENSAFYSASTIPSEPFTITPVSFRFTSTSFPTVSRLIRDRSLTL